MIDVSMALGVARGYTTWWHGFHLIDLGMDEEEEEEVAIVSEGSSKDDPYQVNNSMHDIPM